MPRKTIRSQADIGLYTVLTHKWSSSELDAVVRSLENRDSSTTQATSGAFQALDAKATGLLTHVSMMIAGLGVCAPLLTQQPFEEAVLIGDDRGLSPDRRRLSALPVGRAIGRSFRRRCLTENLCAPRIGARHELYRLCNRASIMFTVVVLFTLPMLLWWKPNV